MKKTLLYQALFLLLIVLSLHGCKSTAGTVSQTEKITITASLQPINSRFDAHPDETALAILDKYKPSLDSLMNQVIGYSEIEMLSAKRPESLLSNFTADAMMGVAEMKNIPVDFSLYNFGGIRNSLPQGTIRLKEIFELFPFENDVVIIILPGKHVHELADYFARVRPEAMGNVKLIIAENRLKSMFINGEPLDKHKMYRIITNNFVAEGGDNMNMLIHAVAIERPGILFRDAIVDYVKMLTQQGRSINASLDGRVVYE